MDMPKFSSVMMLDMWIIAPGPAIDQGESEKDDKLSHR